jgi:hypothetical protein
MMKIVESAVNCSHLLKDIPHGRTVKIVITQNKINLFGTTGLSQLAKMMGDVFAVSKIPGKYHGITLGPVEPMIKSLPLMLAYLIEMQVAEPNDLHELLPAVSEQIVS